MAENIINALISLSIQSVSMFIVIFSSLLTELSQTDKSDAFIS